MGTDVRPVSAEYFANGRLAGQTLVVTGAARGMGRAVAVRGAREGARVIAFDIIERDVAETVAQIVAEGGRATAVVGDVRSPADTDRMVEVGLSAYGRLDLACNAAGVMDAVAPDAPVDVAGDPGLFPAGAADATNEYWDTVMAVNATGVFNACRAEVRAMLAAGTGGSIVNVSSIAGLIGLPGNVAYSASKYAVQGITKSVALSYAADGIRCNSVGMAATDTPMIARAMDFVRQKATLSGGPGFFGSAAQGSKTVSLLAAHDSEHRPATPWEQAAVILFLLSDEGSNITGATWATDGGWTAY